MAKPLNDELQRQLRELALLRDEDIDTSDIPEVTDWSRATRPLQPEASYSEENYDVRAVANAVLKSAWSRGLEVTNMSLNKLVFFVLERALIERNVWLTKARLEAWDHGPVFREIYAHSKKFGDQPVTELIKAYSVPQRQFLDVATELDDTTAADIKAITDELAHLSAARLRALSHAKDSAWDWVYNASQKTSAGMVISPLMILASAHRRSLTRGRR
jgi:uncharacterized phage-associated protein